MIHQNYWFQTELKFESVWIADLIGAANENSKSAIGNP